MRKLAREAVIFMLLCPVGVAIAAYIYGQEGIDSIAERFALRAINATEYLPTSTDRNQYGTVIVPLSTGKRLLLHDCVQYYRITVAPSEHDVFSANRECFYFENGRDVSSAWILAETVLNSPDQVAIEKEYWTQFKQGQHQLRMYSLRVALPVSLLGFPAGLVLWGLYRLIRFAIQG